MTAPLTPEQALARIREMADALKETRGLLDAERTMHAVTRAELTAARATAAAGPKVGDRVRVTMLVGPCDGVIASANRARVDYWVDTDSGGGWFSADEIEVLS